MRNINSAKNVKAQPYIKLSHGPEHLGSLTATCALVVVAADGGTKTMKMARQENTLILRWWKSNDKL